MKAATYISQKCCIIDFNSLLQSKQYDTIIYEGGQGLLLDQSNTDDFPHLTPSSVGLHNIISDIEKLNCIPDIFYVSRTYITRHGAGPMEAECTRENINPEIVDAVNQPNDWQGSLRFGRINLDTLYDRIQKDANQYKGEKNVNLVFTQLNYTNNKIDTINGKIEIKKPQNFHSIYVSDNKYTIEQLVD